MDLSKQTLFRLMRDRMDFLGERQRILAQNVANADTPNYRARDMQQVDFLDAVRRSATRVAPVMTNTAHMPPATPPTKFATDRVKRTYETSPDGNNVILEEQMMKVADTQMEYQTTSMLYKKYVDMMKMAASKGV